MTRQPTPNILADAQPATDAVATAIGPQATEIPVSSIRLDGGTQNRSQLDWVVIAEYSEEMKNGARFPAIDVTYDGEAYWLVDGFHRVNAAKDAKLETILADVKPGTLQDAQWRSYGVNKSHGLRRTNEDKRRAVEAALAHPKASTLSNVQIAAHCGVDEKTIRNHRPPVSSEIPKIDEPAERIVTRGDSTYTMQTGNIGKQPAPQKQWMEIWEIEQVLRRIKSPNFVMLLERIDQWQYRQQITDWLDSQMLSKAYRPRDLVQAGKNVLEQMRQAGQAERPLTPWAAEELEEELLALESVSLSGADEDWLFDHMTDIAKRSGHAITRPVFDMAMRLAIPRQIAALQRQDRLETAINAAIAADAQREQPAPAPAWTDKTIGDVTIWRADSRNLTGETAIPPTVDLVITSPPYNVGIEYSEHFDKMKQEQYIELLHNVFIGCHRVMRHGARLAVVVPFGVGRNPWQPLSLFVAQYIQKAGFTLRGQIVWDKGSSGNRTSWGSFRSPSDPSLRDTTECIIVAHKTQSGAQVPANVMRRDDKGPHSPWLESSDYFMELAQDHWTVAPESAQRIGHPAPFSVKLVKRLVHFYGWPGCTLLDPFGGSGTVGVAAAQLDCKAHVVDIDPAYCALAARRVYAAYAGRQMLEE
jgi:site-specific DNA-methyltransferase (adenine-specific)